MKIGANKSDQRQIAKMYAGKKSTKAISQALSIDEGVINAFSPENVAKVKARAKAAAEAKAEAAKKAK
ncbi:hypothetical protein JKY79_03075 [Candidatus Babeliales bacterium]|nr:hypothetical protein [Candidatus Babeliales bacterium]